MASSSLRETVREDGLRVITKKLLGAQEARLAVRIGTGAAYDPRGRSGKFHFLEHALFRGTANMTVEKINNFVDFYQQRTNKVLNILI